MLPFGGDVRWGWGAPGWTFETNIVLVSNSAEISREQVLKHPSMGGAKFQTPPGNTPTPTHVTAERQHSLVKMYV